MPKIWPALKQSYPFWTGVGLAVVSMVFAGLGLMYQRLDERFAREGVPTEGTVLTKKREDRANSDPRYLLEFGYSDPQEKAVRGWLAVPESVWDTMNPDQKAPIVFLRSEPTTVRLLSPVVKEDGKVQFGFAAGAGTIGVLLIATGLFKIARTRAEA